jgi:hypothetical protein
VFATLWDRHRLLLKVRGPQQTSSFQHITQQLRRGIPQANDRYGDAHVIPFGNARRG